METTVLSTQYQLILPESIRDYLDLKLGQCFIVRPTEQGIELIPCESPSELRGFLAGANTDINDIRDQDRQP